ncbi:MAG: DUF4976 domain-containing protein, partial [Pirellulaceae bacterium]|jgi:N-acetylglucosamine-6-sulfatase|nr:DUF4976 domain-containing protein [Pirellulaceae bacterium]
MLVRYPALAKSGSIIDELALSIDLAPTLLILANARSKDAMDGRSLIPLLAGKRPNGWRTSFLIQYYSDTVFPRIHNMGYEAVRTSLYKYIRYSELEGMDELYDLKNDPYEMHNRVNDPAFQASLDELKEHLAELTGRKE